MEIKDFIAIKKFEELFGGFVFIEEPGNQWVYEKDGHCYPLSDDFLDLIKKSIKDEKDYLVPYVHPVVRYYLEDTFMKPKNEQRVMRFQEGEFPEEYDFRSKRWIVNKDLSQIYFGGIEVDSITEEEAIEIINTRNSNT